MGRRSDILLLNLPYTTFGYNGMRRFASRSLPLGIASLSGILKQDGLSLDILDADAVDLTIDEIISLVAKRKPRIIGMSTYTSYSQITSYVVKEIKKILPNCLVVLGGHHAAAVRGRLLEETTADYVVIGEGETTFSELCSSLLETRGVDHIAGLLYRSGDDVRYAGDRKFIDDLDGIPPPAYELFPMDRYEGHFYRRWISGHRKPFINFITSRGCPFSCGFCANVMWGRAVRYQSPERVLADIDHLISAYGIKQISFFDDAFTMDRVRTHRICDLIIERKYILDIFCSTRVDLIDEELVKKMAASGFKWVGIGIESGNKRILKKIGKGQSTKRCSEALKLLADNGIAIYGNAMLGYPDEDKDTLKDTLTFMLANPVHLPQFNIFVPYPDTPIYNELKARGVDIPQDISQMSGVVSYNPGVSSRYLLLFFYYCYARYFLRLRYLLLIRPVFKLSLMLTDMLRLCLTLLFMDRDRNPAA